MIITHLLGGLGNQMFQYAAGLAVARRRRTVLKLDVSWFRDYTEYEPHNRYGLECFNIAEQFATKEEIDRVRGRPYRRTEHWAAKAAGLMRLPRLAEMHSSAGNWHIQKSPGFYPEFLDIPDDSYLDGMWQSERFFCEDLGPLLRRHFSVRYPEPQSAARLADRIRSGPSALVHFRRGDYATDARFNREIGMLGLDYYHRAIALLRSARPGLTLYIFSDDIDGVERTFKPEGPHVFVRGAEPWHICDELRLMALCDHAIVSNSTFAWWGTWLNPRIDRSIIAPDPWLAGKPVESSEVVPSSWQRIPRSA